MVQLQNDSKVKKISKNNNLKKMKVELTNWFANEHRVCGFAGFAETSLVLGHDSELVLFHFMQVANNVISSKHRIFVGLNPPRKRKWNSKAKK